MPGKFSRLLSRKNRNSSSVQQQPQNQQRVATAAPKLPQCEGDQSSPLSGGSLKDRRHQEGGLFRRLAGRLTTAGRRRTKQPEQAQPERQQRMLAPLPVAEACPMPAESAKLLRPPSPMRPRLLPTTASSALHRSEHRRRLLTPASVDCVGHAASDTETGELLSSISAAAKLESLSLKATASSSDATDCCDNDDQEDEDADSLVSDCVLRLRMTTTEPTTDSVSANNSNNQRRRWSRRGSGKRKRRLRWADRQSVNNHCCCCCCRLCSCRCSLPASADCHECLQRCYLANWSV